MVPEKRNKGTDARVRGTADNFQREMNMPRGDKSSYTDKQKRKAEHIEEGYEDRGVGKEEAERRAWATVNKESGGGKKSGSGRGKKENHSSSKKGGRKGGAASARRTKTKKSSAAKRAAKTRARNKVKGTSARKRKPKARSKRS